MIDPKFIGRKYGPLKYTVSLEKIREFANATGDNNPLYLDEDAAAKGPHGGIVAPPMFAVVWFHSLIAKPILDPDIDINIAMLVHGEQEYEFHSLVRPGDVVISEGEIAAIQAKENLDVISYCVSSKVDGKLVTSGLCSFVVRR